jgi:hypothetical protein
MISIPGSEKGVRYGAIIISALFVDAMDEEAAYFTGG